MTMCVGRNSLLKGRFQVGGGKKNCFHFFYQSWFLFLACLVFKLIKTNDIPVFVKVSEKVVALAGCGQFSE